MWLGKLFGARKRESEIDPDEEPARFVTSVREATGTPGDIKKRLQDAMPAKTTSFDPYNSGTFKKKDDAWQRIGRR